LRLRHLDKLHYKNLFTMEQKLASSDHKVL